MKIEVLVAPACPHRQLTEERLRQALDDCGLNTTDFTTRVITDLAEARRAWFKGSPTVLIDGRDPLAESGAVPSLACRTYRSANGPAGAPSVAQLLRALQVAVDYQHAEEERARLAQEVITKHLTQEVNAADEQAMNAVGTLEAQALSSAARQAKVRLRRWQAESLLDVDTAQAVARAVLQPMEDAHTLAMHSGEVMDVAESQEIGRRAAVTRYWLRDVEGYDIPDDSRHRGL
ncbi:MULTISPECIES: hypothetical protein [unclassified Streptomyces]|uniref:hypothetical protein n=1 Tax=unclassified Streptomyces TaxID=2593676 RepID=UPI00224D95E2|nr:MULTISPECIES: hypothetical protein [unclassified Streptomyces]MCX4834320.1 hypothetical protein [Streptomyces sp. NBC_01016]